MCYLAHRRFDILVNNFQLLSIFELKEVNYFYFLIVVLQAMVSISAWSAGTFSSCPVLVRLLLWFAGTAC